MLYPDNADNLMFFVSIGFGLNETYAQITCLLYYKQLTWFRNIVLKISHILWTVFIRLVLHITGLWPSHGNKLEFFFKQFTTYGSIFLFRLQIIYFRLFISDTCNSYQNIFPLHRIDSFCKTISDNTFNFTNSEFSCC